MCWAIVPNGNPPGASRLKYTNGLGGENRQPKQEPQEAILKGKPHTPPVRDHPAGAGEERGIMRNLDTKKSVVSSEVMSVVRRLADELGISHGKGAHTVKDFFIEKGMSEEDVRSTLTPDAVEAAFAEIKVFSADRPAQVLKDKGERADYREKLTEGAVQQWNAGRWKRKITIDVAEKYRVEKGLDLLDVEDLDAVAAAMAAARDEKDDGAPDTQCGFASATSEEFPDGRCVSAKAYRFKPRSKNVIRGGEVLCHKEGPLAGQPIRTGQHYIFNGQDLTVCPGCAEKLQELRERLYDAAGAERELKYQAERALRDQRRSTGVSSLVSENANRRQPRSSKVERHTGWSRREAR